MNPNNTLEQLRQCFVKNIPSEDSRTGVSPLEFVINIIFCYLSDTQCMTDEAIRRYLKNQNQKDLSRSAFWERLSRIRLKNFLKASIIELMKQLGTTVLGGGGLLNQLGVTRIFVIDSSSFTLWDGAKEDFPGVSTTAGIKWHACFNILTGQLQWFELTPSSTNDRKCFPNLNSLKAKLVIVDLGYWDFTLLWDIANVGGFFLSRIKSNAVLYVKEIIQGKISKK
jgi:putative transposase